eukprot:scaffold47739_cov42-Attheya_sp.AAC.1
MALHQQPDGSMESSGSSSSMRTKTKGVADPSLARYASPVRESAHSDSDTSSLTVVVSRINNKTKGCTKKKTTHKACKYKYPRTI